MGADDQPAEGGTDAEQVINQIAAAEVIERPASVVGHHEEHAGLIKVQIGKRTVRLEPPGNYAFRVDVMGLLRHSPIRAQAAALGMCWRGAGRPRVQYLDHRYNAAVYAGALIREWGAAGMPFGDWAKAGNVALAMCIQGMLTEAQVQAAEDFIEASWGP